MQPVPRHKAQTLWQLDHTLPDTAHSGNDGAHAATGSRVRREAERQARRSAGGHSHGHGVGCAEVDVCFLAVHWARLLHVLQRVRVHGKGEA